MKLIFLDIDGVLATEESSQLGWHEEFAYPFDIDCVMILNEILKKTSAEIILTSNWRLCFHNDLEAIDRLFKYNGVHKSPINITQDLGNREEEIRSYIETHNVHYFVILDDMDLNIYSERFIRCDLGGGIKEKGIKEKIKYVLSM